MEITFFDHVSHRLKSEINHCITNIFIIDHLLYHTYYEGNLGVRVFKMDIIIVKIEKNVYFQFYREKFAYQRVILILRNIYRFTVNTIDITVNLP